MTNPSVRRILVLAAAATAILISGTSTAGAAADDPEETGTAEGPGLTTYTYDQFQNKRSGKCLQVDNRSRNAGAWVVQRTCTTGESKRWQQWRIIDLENGYVLLQARHSDDMCLEVNQAGGSNGKSNNARLLQWNCHRGAQQQWDKTELDAGFLKNRRSNRCVEPDQRAGKGRAEGGPVLQWTCHRGPHQRWEER
ncbi:RICIN domain-containing protein [Nonomuraea sp. NBC_00507]|uniref:RICIN domain-containing protein n=1 Tax=Nonomuraea sp. NBC_00507 TaxID=2976002 RepID=UPI002E193A1F